MPPSTRILLLGGHGKISLFMTPKLVSRSWNVTSVIRNPDQTNAILEAGKNGPGKIDVLVESLDDVKSDADAQRILDKVKPDWVVWSAGAGGKGGAQRTYAIDRDACIHFIRGAIATPSVSKFLLVSALISRRAKAPWWSDGEWESVLKYQTQIMPDYVKAKLAADEVLTVLGEERVEKDGKDKFTYIILRPGTLSDGNETGLVELGKTPARATVTRADVADISARLLEIGGVNGCIDLVNGKEPAQQAVERVAREGIDAREGEDMATMKANIA